MPIPDRNVPEPDIAVVPRVRDAFPSPSEVLLVVEVSDTTLSDDLGRKRRLYAAARVHNFWVADVKARQVHRFADPRDGDYRVHEILGMADTVRVPGAAEGSAAIRVAALFP